MGTYNRICAVSNTPIMQDQKARVFYLVMDVFNINYYREKKLFKTSFSESHCYPNENYKIIGYPLLATYEEDCFYSFDDEEMVQVTLDILNSVYVPNSIHESKKESDYNSCHDYLNIEKLEDMEIVQRMISSGSLRVKSVHGVASVVEMAIHEDIYQQLILVDGWDRGFYMDKKVNFNDVVDDIMNKYIHSDNLIITELDQRNFQFMKDLLMKDNDKSLDEVTKEYNKMLKESGNYDTSYDPTENHQTLTYFKRDIHKYDFPRKIIEANLGALWTNNWFEKHNLEFHTPMTSSTDNDRDYYRHIKRYQDMSNILLKLKRPYEDEETLNLQENVSINLTLNRQEIESKLTSWFNENDDVIVTMKSIIQEIIDNDIKYFVVGDCSRFDQFADEHGLLEYELKGFKIHFDFS